MKVKNALPNFIGYYLLELIEKEFSSHAPEIQEEIIAGVKKFLAEASIWVEDKLNTVAPLTRED